MRGETFLKYIQLPTIHDLETTRPGWLRTFINMIITMAFLWPNMSQTHLTYNTCSSVNIQDEWIVFYIWTGRHDTLDWIVPICLNVSGYELYCISVVKSLYFMFYVCQDIIFCEIIKNLSVCTHLRVNWIKLNWIIIIIIAMGRVRAIFGKFRQFWATNRRIGRQDCCQQCSFWTTWGLNSQLLEPKTVIWAKWQVEI